MTETTVAPPARRTRTVSDILLAVNWIALLGVMFGGYSLLRLLTEIGIDDHAEQFFRAGHAHAGVLTIVGMMFVMTVSRTGATTRAQIVSYVIYFAGVGLLSGGFFVHMAATPGSASLGTAVMTPAGAVLLAGTVVYAVYRLLRRPR